MVGVVWSLCFTQRWCLACSIYLPRPKCIMHTISYNRIHLFQQTPLLGGNPAITRPSCPRLLNPNANRRNVAQWNCSRSSTHVRKRWPMSCGAIRNNRPLQRILPKTTGWCHLHVTSVVNPTWVNAGASLRPPMWGQLEVGNHLRPAAANFLERPLACTSFERKF